MESDCKYQIDIIQLNTRNTADRKLQRLIDHCLRLAEPQEGSLALTKDLIEHYLAVVRSRNKIRRNWHRNEAYHCDIHVLKWMSKKDMKLMLNEEFSKAATISSNGDTVIQGRAIEELKAQITERLFASNRKGTQDTTLKIIVQTIFKSNPDFTGAEIITEMQANPSQYNIVEIDQEYVTIRETIRGGKQTVDKARSLRTVHNILSNIKTSKKTRV